MTDGPRDKMIAAVDSLKRQQSRVVKQYKDSEGDFREWKDAPNHDGNGCCPTPDIRFRHWDSHDGAYTDTFVECRSCGNTYWIDGDDG